MRKARPALVLTLFVAALLLRRPLVRIPLLVVSTLAVLVAVILLAIFPTMPRWPFTGEGFIVAWVAMAAVFTAALLSGASYKYA